MVISQAGSFKGYSLKGWVLSNKNTLKTMLMAMAAVGTYFATTSLSLGLQGVLIPVVAIVSKLAVDSIDFYLSDVEL